MELKISSERVLEAAGKCKEAKEVLQTLFPEVFLFDLIKLVDPEKGCCLFSSEQAKAAGFLDHEFMQIRKGGNLRGISFLLSYRYKWEIVEDNVGQKCLVPSRQ